MDPDHDHNAGTPSGHNNPDVFDDEYAVEELDGLADGFRPEREDSDEAGPQHHRQEPPIRTISAHYASTAGATVAHALLNRRSTRKSTVQDNPFASPEDEPRLEFERSSSVRTSGSYAPGFARRSTSSASSANFAPSHSPRFGAGGPSHPYGMYPQGTLPRSPSAATSSTVRAPTGGSSMRHGPQHPYAMYTQGVSEDEIALDGDAEEEMIAPAPVGFPGIGAQLYRRVRGADGEEQDIIGVDGHAEQLPPYTQYPEDGPKMPLPPPDLHSRQPVAGTDPGMPLMHQQLTTQAVAEPRQLLQSMTDQSQLNRHSATDLGVDPHVSVSLIERSGSITTESTHKSWKEKTWKERRAMKVCGMPLMWIVIAAAVMCFIIAVIGGVVGGYKSGSKAGRQEALKGTLESTTLMDASIIASQTAAAPTGSYALTLSTPTNVAAGCLTSAGQGPAWSCDLVGNPALAISVGVSPGPKATRGAALYYGSGDTEICYGAQYQFMTTDFAPFLTVQDNDDVAKGPAYYFEQTYDKIVVLPEGTFVVPPDSSARKAKRGNSPLVFPPGWGQQKQVVNPGEKPWFCVWNNTVIEGFIYVTETIAASYTATTTPSATTSATTSTSETAKVTLGPSSSGTVTTTVSDSVVTTATPSASYDGRGSRSHGDGDADDHTYRRLRARQTPPAVPTAPDAAYDSLSVYPYVVKIEERRLSGSPTPYCQQYQILNNGQYGPVVYPNTQDAVVIQLEETDPQNSRYKRDWQQGCHCQWSSGE